MELTKEQYEEKIALLEKITALEKQVNQPSVEVEQQPAIERPPLPSAEEMFNSPNTWRNDFRSMDVPNRMLLASSAKKIQASQFLSEQTGVKQETIFDNYEQFSKEYRYSGNHEADWQHISGHFKQIRQIKEARAELAASGIRINGNTVEMFPVDFPKEMAPERFGELFKKLSEYNKDQDFAKAALKSKDPKGFVEALKDGGVPVLDLPKELQELQLTLNLAEAFEQDPSLLDDNQLLRLAQNVGEMQRPSTVGGMVGGILTELPEVGLSFFLSGGAATATKAGLKKGINAVVSKGIQERIQKNLLTRGITKVAGGAITAAARTPVAAAPFAPKTFIDKLTPDMGFTANEKRELSMIVTGEGKNVPEAFKETILDSYIEVASEMLGGAFKPLSKGIKQTLIKSAFARAMLNANPTKKVADLANLVSKTGYHGPLGEMLEERAGDAARALVGLEDWTMPSKDQLLAELIAFSIPAAGMKAANFLLNAGSPGMPAVPSAQQWDGMLNYFTEDQIKERYGEVGVRAAQGDSAAQMEFVDNLMGKDIDPDKVVDIPVKPVDILKEKKTIGPLFHGTGQKPFVKFDNPFAKDAKGGWHMFSTSRLFANKFKKGLHGHVKDVELSLEKTLDLSHLPRERGDVRPKLVKLLESLGLSEDLISKIPYERDLFTFIHREGFRGQLREELIKLGYDSILMPDIIDGIKADTYIVFDSNNISDITAEEIEGVKHSIKDVLIKEAKKYKTAGEFVDAYWNTDATKYLTDINDGSLDDSANSRGSTKSKSEIEREFRNDLKTYDQLSDFEKSIKTEFGQFIRFSNSDGRALGGRLFGLMAKSLEYDYGIPTIGTEIIVANGLSEAMTLRVIGHEMIHRKLAHLDEKTADKVLSAVKELVNDKELIASVRANWKIDGKNTNFGPVMEEILAEHGSRIFGSKFHKAATSGKVSITDTAMSIFKDLLRLIQFSLNGENKKGVDAIAKDLFELSDKAIAGKYKDQKISIFSSNRNRKANESKLLEINEQSNPENNNKRFLTKEQLIDIWNKAHNQSESVKTKIKPAPGAAQDEKPLKRITQLKHASIDDDIRPRLGLEALDPAQRQTSESLYQEVIKENLDEQALGFAVELIKKPVPISAKEHHAMVLAEAKLERLYEEQSAQASEQYALGLQESGDMYSNMAMATLANIETLTRASRLSGTEIGRALNARKIAIEKERYKLVNLTNKATALKKESLTQEEKNKLQTLSVKVKEQTAKIAELEAALEKAALEKEEFDAANAVKEFAGVKNQRKKNTAKQEREELKEELRKLGMQINDITNTIGLSVEISNILSRIAITHIEEGATTLKEVVRRVQQDVPEASKRDIFNSLGGRVKAETKRVEKEITKRIRELKTQANLEGQIIDALKGKFDDPRSIKESSKRVKELRKKLNNLRASTYNTVKDDAQLKKINLKINEVQDLLAGKFVEEKKAKPVKKDSVKVAAAKEKLKLLREEVAKRKRLQKKIEDLESKIEGTKVAKITKDANEESKEVNKLRDEIEELEIIIEDMNKKSGITDDARQTKTLRNLQAKISEIEYSLETNTRPIKDTAPKVKRPDVQAASKKFSELKRLMDTLDAISDLQEQLRLGPSHYKISAPRKRVVMNEELNQALVEKKKLEQEIDSTLADLKRNTPVGRMVEALYTSRAMMAMADFSYFLRQGLILSARRPGLALKSFGTAFSVTFDHDKALLLDITIKGMPEQIERDKHGLWLSSLDKGIHESEEAFLSRLIDKAPVYRSVSRASERNMVTGLNLLRVSIFDAFIKDHPESTYEQRAAYAHYINVASGRGDLGTLSAVGRQLSAIFFAPRFAVSRFQAPWQVVKNWQDPLLRKEIGKDLLYLAMTGSSILWLAWVNGMATFDPEDSDFGKIVWGNTRIDIWGGLQQPMRLIMRPILALGNTTGVRPTDQDIDLWDAGSRFLAYKTSPAVNIPMTLAMGKNIIGQEQGLGETAIRSITPLVVQETYDVWDNTRRVDKAAAAAAMTALGIGVQEHSDN